MKRILTAALAACAATMTLAACSSEPAKAPTLAKGNWTLDEGASRISYVTIKADEIAENNDFKNLSGAVTAEGAATITIDLASVETGVDIRNERMRDVLFNVAEFPSATVSAQLDRVAFASLDVGESTLQTIDTIVTIKGVEKNFAAELDVTRLSDDRVLAVSIKPVLVNAGGFELTEGLAKLQELASLPSITPVVPVTVSLEFQRK